MESTTVQTQMLWWAIVRLNSLLLARRNDTCLTRGLFSISHACADAKKLKGRVVSPATPKTAAGLYWGYSVRLASSLGKVFTESPHKDGYDCLIGTSERGKPVDEFSMPSFR